MKRLLTATAVLALTACANNPAGPAESESPEPDASPITAAPAEEPSDDATPESAQPASPSPDPEAVAEFETTEHETFDEPWAMTFLPGADAMLITERGGTLQQRDVATGELRAVEGVPEVHAAGQGGLHDVVASPGYEDDHTVYLSWVEMAPTGPRGMVAAFEYNHFNAELGQMTTLWKQDIVEGDGHFSLRLLVQEDKLFVTSGDRQAMDPAQDHGVNLGKVLRLELDGTPAADNPFGSEGAEAQVWTIGHRNPLGIDADSQGNVWITEMGPQGGDELNLLAPGENYGWPEASMGVHYDGTDIPDHADGDGFTAPAVAWVPSISPGSLEIYDGDLFTGWKDSALIGGLSGEVLVRVALDAETATEAAQWPMGARIRAVEEGPDGAIWILTDGEDGQLLELRPA